VEAFPGYHNGESPGSGYRRQPSAVWADPQFHGVHQVIPVDAPRQLSLSRYPFGLPLHPGEQTTHPAILRIPEETLLTLIKPAWPNRKVQPQRRMKVSKCDENGFRSSNFHIKRSGSHFPDI
jgi:hypothetical protein